MHKCQLRWVSDTFEGDRFYVGFLGSVAFGAVSGDGPSGRRWIGYVYRDGRQVKLSTFRTLGEAKRRIGDEVPSLPSAVRQ